MDSDSEGRDAGGSLSVELRITYCNDRSSAATARSRPVRRKICGVRTPYHRLWSSRAAREEHRSRPRAPRDRIRVRPIDRARSSVRPSTGSNVRGPRSPGRRTAPEEWADSVVRGDFHSPSADRESHGVRSVRPSFVDRPDITNTAIPLRRGKTVVRKHDAI